MEKINYFGLSHALKEHDDIIRISGGLHGVKEPELIESTLYFIQHDDYYPSYLVKLSELIERIATFHMFVDGNKRTSIVLGAYFLEINDFTKDIIDHFIIEMENIIVLLVDRALSSESFHELLSVIISGNPYPERLQLVLFQAHLKFEQNEKCRKDEQKQFKK